jgi:hypothetical protein
MLEEAGEVFLQQEMVALAGAEMVVTEITMEHQEMLTQVEVLAGEVVQMVEVGQVALES